MSLSRPPIRVRIVGATDVGLIREHNEDNLLSLDLDTGDSDFSQLREYELGPRGLLMVVCDGMGGAAAGEVASSMAVDSLRRQMLTAVQLNASNAAKSGSVESASKSGPGNGEQSGRVITMEAEADGSGFGEPSSVANPTSAAPNPALLAALEKPSPPPEISAISSPAVAAVPAVASAPKDPPAASAEPAAPQSSSDKLSKSESSILTEAEVHGWARKLRTATQNANQEIFEAACADIAKAGMGTTLTGLLLLRNQVIVAQVGDSRAYLWRQGRLVQITHDQSLVNQLLDSGQITPEQAKLFEHSNVILQALGVQEDVEVVLSHEHLRRDDRILLCSDGLVGVVTDDEIQAVLATVESPEEAVRMLIEMARAGGGPDNITVIVAHVLGEGLAVAEADEVVAYRTMALEGEKPPDRRVWPGDYQSGSGAANSRDVAPVGAAPRNWLSSSLVMVIAAALALVVTGLVIAFVLYPQRTTKIDSVPALVTCSLRTDQAGQRVYVDEQEVAISQTPRTEVKLAPGPHEVWLVSATGSGRSVPQSIQANFRQPCELQLFAIVAAEPPTSPTAASGDGPVPAARDGGAVATGDVPPGTPEGHETTVDAGSAAKPGETPSVAPGKPAIPGGETDPDKLPAGVGHEEGLGPDKPEETPAGVAAKGPRKPIKRPKPKVRPAGEPAGPKTPPVTPPVTPGTEPGGTPPTENGTGTPPAPPTPPVSTPPDAAGKGQAEPKAATPGPEKPRPPITPAPTPAPTGDSAEKPKPAPEAAPKASPPPPAAPKVSPPPAAPPAAPTATPPAAAPKPAP